MTGSLMHKLGMQQAAKFALQAGTHRQGWMQIIGEKTKTNIPNYLNSSTNKTHMYDYFHSSDNKEADKKACETITNRIHNEFTNLFSGI